MSARLAMILLALALGGCPTAPSEEDASARDSSASDTGTSDAGQTLEAGMVEDTGLALDADDGAASPDAGGAVRSFVYVGIASGDLVTLDGETLAEIGRTRTGDYPSFVAASSDGSRLYAIHERANEVAALAVAADGTTSVLDRQPAGGGPTHVSIDHGGRWVFTASYGSGEVRVFPITGTGSLGASVTSVVAGANAHQIVSDADDAFVYVPCLGIDAVIGFALDGTTGALARVGASMGAGDGARHLALSPDGTRAYVLNELSGEIDVFLVRGDGHLDLRSTISSLPAGHTGPNASAEILVTRDGAHVYASNRGPDTVAVFRASGDALTLVEQEPCGGAHPRSMTLSLDERRLLVANRDSDGVSVFDVDATDGSLTFVRTLTFPGRPFFVGAFRAP